MDMFDVGDFCRACLRNECSLTDITSLDHDSIKFSDKLMACVAEVMWLKEGLLSLICSNCIECLRVAYDFRNVCLQSHQTFMRYISGIQDENMSERPQVENKSPLKVETKIEVTSTQVVTDTLPYIKEEPLNSPQMHVLVDDDCFVKPEHFVDMDEFKNSIPKLEKFQRQSEPIIDSIDRQHNIEELDSKEDIRMIQLDQQQHSHNEPQPQHELQMQKQPLPRNQVFEETTGTQERLRSPENIPLDGVRSDRYTCKECNKTFRCNNSLRAHKRSHASEDVRKCKYCKKGFYNSTVLKRHIRSHTGEEPFQCESCSQQFITKCELKLHMRSHTSKRPFVCTVCDQKCDTVTALKVHTRMHTGEKPYSCKTCGKKFAYTNNLNSHIKTHTGSRPFKCKICEKTFSRNSNLNVHMKIHTGEKVTCNVCDLKFTHAYNLKIHMRKHTSKQPYPRTVNSEQQQLIHLQNEPQLQDKPRVQQQLSQQKQVVKQEADVQVQLRSPESVTSDSVQPKGYICTVCNKTYWSSGGLSYHMQTHTGEKSFECKYCKKRFYRSVDLGMHIKRHKGEKPHQCAVCNKQFIFSYELQRHMWTHTDKTPFACTV